MCGIAGYAGWACRHEESRAHLAGMCDAIRHRGPDDEGHFIGNGVALGMRRLSIIDLDTGRQPISNEDGTVTVVFNGEVYNYGELRERLASRGHTLATRSDTETLVHLYEDHGEDLVLHLNGMFGFSIWDERRRTLLLGRDRLGIKPLYYWEDDGGIAFASDLRSFSRLERFAPALDEGGIASYMTLGYIPDPETVFDGVKKLPPGHTLSWSADSGVRVREYWHPTDQRQIEIGEVEAVEEIQRLLTDSVRLRLISDVPLGAFLSGGTDSSAVVAMMARQATGPVRTFSIGFDEAEYNEAHYAAELADHLGTDHTELIVRPDADELIEDIVASFGEPFADSSAIPTFLVSQLASEHVTVALSGDGGDELFGGYTRYMQIAHRREVPSAGLRRAMRMVGRRLPLGAYGRNRILDLSRTRPGRYAGTVAMPLRPDEGGVCQPRLVGQSPPFDELLDPWFERAEGRDFQTQVALVDLMTYLPGDILTKVDRMSMACSLEARVPLLDHRLVEFAVSLPSHLKVRDGSGKWIFRRAIADLVPEAVLTREKRGFALPLDRWFRNELAHRVDAILQADAPIYDFLDLEAVSRIVGEHQRARRDHSHLLWRILVLHVWLDRFAESGGPPLCS